MSFEHPAFSFDQRGPPTPTRTPTSPSFADAFKTPKFDSSFFSDSSLLKTPKPPSFGSTNAGQVNDFDFIANAQHLLATPDFSALPIGSSFDSTPKAATSQTITQPSLQLDTSFEPSSSIQTPPPTSSSSLKKSSKKGQNGKEPSPSRRKSVPILPKPAGSGSSGIVVETSPGELDLGFSPAEFGWAPQTAPAYPQQKLFWDGETTGSMSMDIPANLSFDQPRTGLQAFVSTHPSVSTSQRTITADFDFGEDRTPMASFSADLDDFGSQQAFSGVDPSLLLSSPGRGGNIVPPLEDSSQPYAYQLQEARREKVYGGVGKARRRRKPSVDSPAVRAALEQLREDNPKSVLSRSMTDSALPRLSRDPLSRTGTAHGRSSPVKTMRRPSRKHSHRTSIALTIDENGRARAEARPDGVMDVDSDSASSCTSSSIEDIPDEMVTSFSGPRIGQFGRSSNHSQQSSRASFYFPTNHQDIQVQVASLVGQRRPAVTEDESEAETVLNSDDEDNAQDQLRKTMQDRQRLTAHHHHSPQGTSTAFFPEFSSPTTIPDPELPSPYAGNSPTHSEIRCVCNTALNDGQMIQCESCKKWLHIACTGLKTNHLPNIYLCLFCTGNTPIARGNRVRDPVRKAYRPSGTGPSPLAQKGRRR